MNSYRPTLFRKSQATQYICFIAAETLLCSVKPVNCINSAGSYVPSHSYLYSDQLCITRLQPIKVPEVHVVDLMECMKEDEDLQTSLMELTVRGPKARLTVSVCITLELMVMIKVEIHYLHLASIYYTDSLIY